MTQNIEKKNVWALMHDNGSLIIVGGNLPIYWYKKVAEKYAKEFGGNVVKINGSKLTKLLNK